MNAASRSLCALVAILTGQFSFPPSMFADMPTLSSRPAPRAVKLEGRFTGPWVTTNRKLDGVMTCDVTQLAAGRWQGRFYGEWQKVPFDFTVEFTAGEKQFAADGVAADDPAGRIRAAHSRNARDGHRDD